MTRRAAENHRHVVATSSFGRIVISPEPRVPAALLSEMYHSCAGGDCAHGTLSRAKDPAGLVLKDDLEPVLCVQFQMHAGA
jgi:hypothetical protein